MSTLLLIPRIKIHNANALSSPYTIGFPAMTAWLGAVHALQRKLNRLEEYEDLKLNRMAVVSHEFNLQTYKGPSDYVASIVSTGNPLVEKKKRKKGEKWENFERPSFIEEARCHLTVSLVIKCDDLGLIDEDEFLEKVVTTLTTMKIASGDVMPLKYSPELETVDDGQAFKQFTRKLMPGFCLIERRELMQQAMADGQDAIDALLDYLSIHHLCKEHEKGEIVWSSQRKTKGWIVPIATGFHGISDLGHAENQRDPDTPHRFAESIVTLGEFVMPYRIETLDQLLWQYDTDLDNHLYLCKQAQSITQ